jgi:glycosyltransferase involved in cell wall biosynthesis
MKPLIGLKPISAPGNRFAGLFAEHIDRSHFDLEGFEWEKLGQRRYDLVVFHWPTEFFRPESRKATLALLGRMLQDKLVRGTKFIWVVHNLEPHDGGSMRSALTTHLFLKLLDGIILLSRHSGEELRRLYPGTKRLRALTTVHARYAPLAGPPRDFAAQGRQNRLLFFGMIREYKNVERLVAEARKVRIAPFSLTVLGACPDAALEARIRTAAGEDGRIVLDMRKEFIPDDELERAIDAHDAVVLPYRNILNSGVALHALGRNKPILAPRIGSLPELQERVGSEWADLFDGEIDTARLEAFLAGLDACIAPAPDLSALEWPRVGEDVSAFLWTFCQAGRR